MTRANGQALATRQADNLTALEAVIAKGDMSLLTEQERLAYYYMRCDAAGLDPRSQPFQYVQFEAKDGVPGKLQLYATKAATDQLIANRKISVTITDRHYEPEVECYEATCRATLPDGQFSDDLGVVFIGKSFGQAKANGVMKAVTKAKRRSVLSVCGLGMLDESEVETIPGARLAAPEMPPAATARPIEPSHGEFLPWLQDQVDQAENNWKMACVLAKKDHMPLGDKGKRLSPWQVCNGVVKGWIARQIFVKAEVETDGKWDQKKAFAVLKQEWESDPQRRTDLIEDISHYLQDKADATAQAAGINQDAEPAEEPA